jgi:hypothetical protein
MGTRRRAVSALPFVMLAALALGGCGRRTASPTGKFGPPPAKHAARGSQAAGSRGVTTVPASRAGGGAAHDHGREVTSGAGHGASPPGAAPAPDRRRPIQVAPRGKQRQPVS